MSTDLTAVEIFAGGGGLAVGLRDAGFKTVAAVELEPHAVATFKANHPTVTVFQQDVRTISGATLLGLAGGSLDVLAACPPCQGFSSLTSKWRRADPRNLLISEVGRLASEMLPKAVMVENVPGLAQQGRPLFDDLLASLENLGYICNWDVLQVADFGVPQKRRRLVLLAGLGFKIEMPAPTHSKGGLNGLPMWRTVRNALESITADALVLNEAKQLGGPAAHNWHVTRQLSKANKARLKYAKPGAGWGVIPEDVRPPMSSRGLRWFLQRIRANVLG